MFVSVDFREDELDDLINMYLARIKEKKTAVADLERDIKSINAKVAQLRIALKNATYSGQINPLPADKVYSDKWTWVQKISFAIEQERRALTANEIFDFLVAFEPDFKNDRRKIMGSISGTLSIKSGPYEEGRDFVRIEGGGDFTYQNYRDYIKPVVGKDSVLGMTINFDETPSWLKD